MTGELPLLATTGDKSACSSEDPVQPKLTNMKNNLYGKVIKIDIYTSEAE